MRYKPRVRLGFWLIVVIAPLLLVQAVAADGKKEADDGLDVYFRSGGLLSVTDQGLPKYPKTETGDSKKIARDFPDAPPQIPHTVEDMYPIFVDENECVDCHHPENAVSKDDVPLSDSHFEAAVMGKGGKGDPMIWVVKDYKKTKNVVGSRYNCDMCHAPQATNVKSLPNSFSARRKTGK